MRSRRSSHDARSTQQHLQITDIIETAALQELAQFYRHTSGDLRRVLAAAHEATEHAATDQAPHVGLPHMRFGIAQWQ